jgi:hypothetical protein
MTLQGYHGAISDVIGGEVRGVYSSRSGFELGFLVDFTEKRHGEDRSDLADLR